MSEPVRRLLVTYDVSCDRRRDRLAVLLQAHGERVQYSVFVVDGRPAAFVRLRDAVSHLIDADTDCVLFVDLGAREVARDQRMTYLGRRRVLMGDSDSLVL